MLKCQIAFIYLHIMLYYYLLITSFIFNGLFHIGHISHIFWRINFEIYLLTSWNVEAY